MITAHFYPDPSHGLGSIDGGVRRVLANRTWSQIRDGAGNQSDETRLTESMVISCHTTSDKYDAIHRIILTFNTVSIPIGAIIVDAKLRLYVVSWMVDTPFANAPKVAVFESYPNDVDYLVDADYGHIYDTVLSNEVKFVDLPINNHVILILNAIGLTKVTPAGVTKLALRESYWDAGNIQPPWKAHDNWSVIFRMRDSNPLSQRPRLTIDYYDPSYKRSALPSAREGTAARLQSSARILSPVRIIDP